MDRHPGVGSEAETDPSSFDLEDGDLQHDLKIFGSEARSEPIQCVPLLPWRPLYSRVSQIPSGAHCQVGNRIDAVRVMSTAG